MSVDRWLEELELLEALDCDREARSVVLRMGRLAHEGRLEGFRRVVREDEALDEETRSWVLGLARNEAFLVAAHGYAERHGDRQ